MLKFRQLCERIVHEGFVSGMEPLVINFPRGLSDLGLDNVWGTPPGVDQDTGHCNIATQP